MDIDALPNLILDTSFASQLGLASVAGLLRMVEEGTLPAPSYRRGDKPIWSEDNVMSFFSQLQAEQSAYASIDQELGQSELSTLHAYVCPALSSKHIGIRRPSNLALYKGGTQRNSEGYFELDVYPVQWVQTELGVAGEKIAAPAGIDLSTIVPVSWSNVRPDAEEPLTLFKLDVEGRKTLLTKTGIRRGGTISTDSLQRALTKHAGNPVHFKGGVVHLLD